MPRSCLDGTVSRCYLGRASLSAVGGLLVVYRWLLAVALGGGSVVSRWCLLGGIAAMPRCCFGVAGGLLVVSW